MTDFGGLDAEIIDFVEVFWKDFGGLEAEIFHVVFGFGRNLGGLEADMSCILFWFWTDFVCFWPEQKALNPYRSSRIF